MSTIRENRSKKPNIEEYDLTIDQLSNYVLERKKNENHNFKYSSRGNFSSIIFYFGAILFFVCLYSYNVVFDYFKPIENCFYETIFQYLLLALYFLVFCIIIYIFKIAIDFVLKIIFYKKFNYDKKIEQFLYDEERWERDESERSRQGKK